MAYRRKRRFRGISRPVARVNRVFDRTLFASTVDVSGVNGTFQILTSGDGFISSGVNQGVAVGGNRVCTVKRVVIDSNILVRPLTTAFQEADFHLAWALFVADAEDTDVALNTTALGSILQGGSGRVLRTGSYACGVVESTGTATAMPAIRPPYKLEVDWKGSVGLNFDQRLYLAYQVQNTAVAYVSTCSVYGITNVLCQW